MKSRLTGLVVTLLALGASSLGAATINILWYTGGTESSGAGTYEAAVNNLVAQENSAFNVSGSINTWNVTFWSGGAIPGGSFAGYNALVTASPQGYWSTPGSTADLLGSGITSASLGSRIMLTGQDADWHYINGPGSASFNGPAGFLIDAINWAGSGTGMGGVFLGNRGLGLFDSSNGTDAGYSNAVTIPAADAALPINVGLTSAGLSGWNTSAHVSFSGYDSTKWEGINTGDGLFDAAGKPVAITIITASEKGGGTSGVPDSGSTLSLLGGVMLALVGLRRRLA